MSILTDPHRGREPEISEHKIQAGLAITRKKTKLRYVISRIRKAEDCPTTALKGRRQDIQNPRENSFQTLPSYASNHDVLL